MAKKFNRNVRREARKAEKSGTALSSKGDKFVALPREQVAEPTRSPFVVWSQKYRFIVDKADSLADAKKKAKGYNRGLK